MPEQEELEVDAIAWPQDILERVKQSQAAPDLQQERILVNSINLFTQQ